MNQHQRKFLLESIEKQYRAEREKLKTEKPKEPSLNNYLISSILDGSFVIKSREGIRDCVLFRVRNLGKHDAFVINDEGYGYGRKRDEEMDSVKIPVDVLFDLPPQYVEAKAKYDEDLERYEESIKALDSSMEAMKIKVAVGSDKALEVLVEQADKLCSMSITASSRLLLGGGK